MKTSQWRRAVENWCVFSARLKALSDKSDDHSAGDRRFHVKIEYRGVKVLQQWRGSGGNVRLSHLLMSFLF